MKQHRRTFLLALLAAVIIVPVLAIALSGCSHHAGPPPC